MHNLFLWDEPALDGLSFGEKNVVIHSALKAYRAKNPINVVNAILMVFLTVLIPSALFAYYHFFTASVGWASVITLILNIRMAKKETPYLKPYLVDMSK